MGDAGCSVAHAVWVFARRGVPMESFARYREAGVNMSLGTDTNPQSVVEAMRWAAVLVQDDGAQHAGDDGGSRRSTPRRSAGRGPSAATTWAASRRAPRPTSSSGRAASWGMTPLRDPVKNLVYNATADDVDRVCVNGRVRSSTAGRVLAADERQILEALQAGGDRMWPRMREFDWAGRGADELSPQTYPEWR